MANDKKKNAAPVSETEWNDHDTADAGASYEKAEWVEPAPGLTLEGTLMRAFVMKDDLAASSGGKKFRAGYVYADAQGHEWTFGEKAGFAAAIREQNLGVHFCLTFVEKKKQLDTKTQRPTGKTIWVTKFKTKGVGVGDSVAEALDRSHKELLKSGAALDY